MIDLQLNQIQKIGRKIEYRFDFSILSQNSNSPIKNYYITRNKRVITAQDEGKARQMLSPGEALARVVTLTIEGTSIILEDSEVEGTRGGL